MLLLFWNFPVLLRLLMLRLLAASDEPPGRFASNAKARLGPLETFARR